MRLRNETKPKGISLYYGTDYTFLIRSVPLSLLHVFFLSLQTRPCFFVLLTLVSTNKSQNTEMN